MPSEPGIHVLIIEDEMLIALELEALLGDLGFRSFDIADSPAQAFACATARRPDLITADIRIVGGSGLEAVSQIFAALGAIPVIYVTGNRTLAPSGRAAAVVDKPIVPRALAVACQRVLAAA